MQQDDKPLSLAAEKAVRTYIVKLLTPPALVLSVGAFFFGYGIKDVAVAKAEADARVQIARALAEAEVARDVAKRAVEDAERIRGRLDTASQLALSKTDEFYTKLTSSLIADRSFMDQVTRSLGTNYVRLDELYYVTSNISGLNLDVLYGRKDVGAPVGQAIAHPAQTWKITIPPK